MTKIIKRTRRPALEPTADLFGDFDRMMAGFFRPVSDLAGGPTNGWAPAVDIRETPEAFIVDAELPGLKADDVTVTFEDGVLTLSGERAYSDETEHANYRRAERRYGAFSRSFNLGRQVDADRVEASFSDGVLVVNVPKKEQVKPRTIKVN